MLRTLDRLEAVSYAPIRPAFGHHGTPATLAGSADVRKLFRDGARDFAMVAFRLLAPSLADAGPLPDAERL